jgi:hypothetical protein
MEQNDRSLLRVALTIIVIVLAINFLTMPAEEYPGDAHAVRVETTILLDTGKWAIPSEIAEKFGERGQYFYQNPNGNWYPKYGTLNTLIYVPALWLERVATGNLAIDSSSRLLFLNLLNLILSAATALYLVLLARRYTKSNAVVAIFVLAALYSTFWWNYLRAQTFEIYHTLFLLAFYYHLVSGFDLQRTDSNRRKSDAQLFIAAIFFGALCLCKTVYTALLPALVVIWALLKTGSIPPVTRKHRDRFLRPFLFFCLPACIFLCILAAANWCKFGSPLVTGYTQWEKESHPFHANVIPALWGFLFSPHHSVFLHFPVLLFALAGWPNFFRKHKPDAIAAAFFGITLLLVNSMYINWRGESSYGPRYLLPILPILSLPFIEYLTWLIKRPNRIAKSLLGGGTIALLVYSFLLQVSVNTSPFFFCYSLKDILDDKRFSKPATYLRSHSFGTIDRDFLLYKFGYPSPFTGRFLDQLNAAEVERFSGLTESLRSNYYWFPNLLREEK